MNKNLNIEIDIKKPTKEELESIINPLIPEPIKGDKGEDGKDGYTPIKGVDYFDGKNGKDAKPPTKKELKEIIKPLIPKPIKGKDGKDGRDGKDGISPSIEDIKKEIGNIEIEYTQILNTPPIEEIVKKTSLASKTHSFLELEDTPKTYEGQAGKVAKVNPTETALIFGDATDTDEKTKVSANDTTAGYLNGKLVAGPGITFQENSDGGNETLEIINSLSSILVDTREDILASTPTSETVAYATDTQQFYVFDETNWQESSSYFGERNANLNVGASQESNVNDIGRDFIANKRLSNIKVGGYNKDVSNSDNDRGALKVEEDSITGDSEMYLWSTQSETWRRFLAGIALRNDVENQALVTDDFFDYTINLFTGDSFEVDGNGLPLVQRGSVSVGAFQRPPIVEGGSF